MKGLFFFFSFFLAPGLRGMWAELCKVSHCSSNSLALPAHQADCSSGNSIPC